MSYNDYQLGEVIEMPHIVSHWCRWFRSDNQCLAAEFRRQRFRSVSVQTRLWTRRTRHVCFSHSIHTGKQHQSHIGYWG